MTKNLCCLIIFSMVSACLPVCQSSPENPPVKYSDNKYIKVSEQQNIADFLYDVYKARINIVVYNREASLRHLNQAMNKASKMKQSEKVLPIMLEVIFTNKGLKHLMYLAINKTEGMNLNNVAKDLKSINKEISSINLVNATEPIIASDNLTYLKNAVSALSNINADDPAKDFDTAYRELDKIYILWKIRPYEKDIKFETEQYLKAAEFFMDQKNYSLAKESLKRAEGSFQRSLLISGFDQSHKVFVSNYKGRLSLLKDRLEKENTILPPKIKKELEKLF